MLLEFAGVQKCFGSTQALSNVTAKIDGRAIGLLGPNGAGKTTLMRVCLGLIRPDAGSVRVLGLDAVADPTEVRRRLGYAAEGPGRMPGLSGLESVALAAELCGLRRRTALLRAHDMLDLVGLDESRYRPVETYSTGMHQRVKVAMALVHDPEMVLLDEPTSGLDPESRDELLDLVVHLRDGGGPAVVLSTHLLQDVEKTCDACLIMQDGQVRYSGTIAALQQADSTRFALRVTRNADGLAAHLRDAGATVEAGERENALVVTLPIDADPALIWQIAASADIPVIELQPKSASLEDAFLSAIGRS